MSRTMESSGLASSYADDDSAANGATDVITGVDKTSACSMLITFPSRPLIIKMSATYEDRRLFAPEGMRKSRNEGKAKILSSVPNNHVPRPVGMRPIA